MINVGRLAGLPKNWNIGKGLEVQKNVWNNKKTKSTVCFCA